MSNPLGNDDANQRGGCFFLLIGALVSIVVAWKVAALAYGAFDEGTSTDGAELAAVIVFLIAFAAAFAIAWALVDYFGS